MPSGRNPFSTRFRITHETEPSETLIAGFSEFGLAGLTAVDYVVNHLELIETGHITAEQLPSITPFQNGRPRHHTRLFSRPDLDVTFLVGELFVPIWAADSFSNAILEWTGENSVDEVAVLSGIPLPHGPDDHRTFYIATDDYREARLTEDAVPAMGNGFLDGVNASLVERGLDSSLRVGVFVTPAHARTPDVEASLRLLDTLNEVYHLRIDTGPLEDFAAEVEKHYAELSKRLEAVEEQAKPEDRMYM